jgi:hypothetical protein
LDKDVASGKAIVNDGNSRILQENQSRLGLDQPHSLLERLGLFLSVLFLGPLIGLLLLAGLSVVEGPAKSVAMILLESLGVFWIAVLVYIWWRPRWFRRIYLWTEGKLILVVQLLILGGVAYFVVSCVRN